MSLNTTDQKMPGPEASSTFLRQNAVFWGLSIGTGALNLAFNIVGARWLAPAVFGQFSALVALINLFLVPMSGLTLIAAGLASRLDDHGAIQQILRQTSPLLVLLGFGSALVVMALSPWIAAILKISNWGWVAVAGWIFLPGYIGSLNTGILQGLRLFRAVGVMTLVATGVRFCLVIGLLALGVGVGSVSGSSILGFLGTWILTHRILSRHLRQTRAASAGRWSLEPGVLLPAYLTTANMVFSSLDILMAKHFLGPVQAGYFGVLGVAGRIIVAGTASFPLVLYPYLVRHRRDGPAQFRYLGIALAATLVIGGSAVAAYWIFPDDAIKGVYGAPYVPASHYLGWYGLAFFLYALANVLLTYFLAHQSRWLKVYVLSGAIAEFFALALLHHGIQQIIDGLLVVFGSLLLATGIHVLCHLYRHRTPALFPHEAPLPSDFQADA